MGVEFTIVTLHPIGSALRRVNDRTLNTGSPVVPSVSVVVGTAESPTSVWTTPTGVVEDSCFRQVELAGVLRGARNEKGARKLIDFMLSTRFQEDVPLSMFVFPVNRDAVLPTEFVKYAIVPVSPLELSPEKIEANRERWVDEWTQIALR